MIRRRILTLGLSVIVGLAIAACDGASAPSGSATAPSSAAVSVAPSPALSASPSGSPSASAAASVAPSGSPAACSAVEAGFGVAVSIKEFFFNPATIRAAVGQVISFTDDGSIAHTATLADDSCSTSVLEPGQREGLVFTARGTYPFRCDIHRSMVGTITIN
jgi:plastocyanin